jgi:phage/plasmid-like protein (TIGR03299 family)
MAHNIDMTNGRANIAFLGSRNDVWHRLGQEMAPGQSIADWAKAAGLEWSAVKVPAIPALVGPQWDHIEPAKRMLPVDGWNFTVRSDTGTALGYGSDGRQEVQPLELLEWFDRYVGVDARFHLDCAGSLKGGRIVWATAVFEDEQTVVGEAHKARLLMTTAYDGTGSTLNKGTMTRVVCNNTLDAALSDARCTIRTRHSTKFNPERVAHELAAIASGFEQYKTMAEGMVQIDMAKESVSQFFKTMLEIPFDAKESDVSGRKLNQFQALQSAYRQTVAEGTKPLTAWTALNAVTRYVDHDRSTRGADSKEEAKFLSANFGSGAAMKAKAVGLLMPSFKVPELVAA